VSYKSGAATTRVPRAPALVLAGQRGGASTVAERLDCPEGGEQTQKNRESDQGSPIQRRSRHTREHRHEEPHDQEEHRADPTGAGVIDDQAASLLHKTLAHPPLVLLQQHASELGKAFRRIVENPKDCLSRGDRERYQSALRVVRMLEQVGSVEEPSTSEKTGELEHKVVRDGMPAASERTYVRCRMEDPQIEERSRPSRGRLASSASPHP
jgi:hypothetical protein